MPPSHPGRMGPRPRQWGTFNVADVEVRELNTSNPLGRIRIRVLEVKIVHSFLVKLG